MVIQHLSSALHAPAVSLAYPMAKPGYGKRSAPGQQARTRDDFALLPTRERYVAGFVDHLPDGASMSVKQLAKQLPLYGQQAISTALKALSVAGHLRRVRCAVGAGDETRWVFRTFWSRTARDNEWWTTYLATETATQTAAPAPPPARTEGPAVAEQAPEPTPVPPQRTPPQAPDAEPAQTTGPSPAYLALARLGRNDHRLGLSAHDCTTLEPLAAQWLDRGVTTDYLTSTLTTGLPAQIDSPAGLLRRRLIDKRRMHRLRPPRPTRSPPRRPLPPLPHRPLDRRPALTRPHPDRRRQSPHGQPPQPPQTRLKPSPQLPSHHCSADGIPVPFELDIDTSGLA